MFLKKIGYNEAMKTYILTTLLLGFSSVAMGQIKTAAGPLSGQVVGAIAFNTGAASFDQCLIGAFTVNAASNNSTSKAQVLCRLLPATTVIPAYALSGVTVVSNVFRGTGHVDPSTCTQSGSGASLRITCGWTP
jgi:hypothetical protein